MAYLRQTLRLAVDVTDPRGIVNQSGRSPFFWRNNDVRFDFAFVQGDALIDVSAWNALTLRIKPLDNITGDPVASKTVTAFDAALTLDQWTSGASQHATITLTQAESGIPAGEYHFVVSATANTVPATEVTLGTGVITCIEDGRNGTAAPPVDPDAYYNREVSDARFASTTALAAHEALRDNPHQVTKADVDLANVDNTSDELKEVYTARQLKTARKINGVDFNGTIDIESWVPTEDNAKDLGKGTGPMKRFLNGWFSGTVSAGTFVGNYVFDPEDPETFIGWDVDSGYTIGGPSGWHIPGGISIPYSAFPNVVGVYFGTLGTKYLSCDGSDYCLGGGGRLQVGGAWVVTEGTINATMVGLGSVDNTPDLAKPVSGPQAEAIAAGKFEALHLVADDGKIIQFKAILEDGIYQFRQTAIITP